MPEEAATSLEPESRGKRLDSWKEIAAHLDRHVTTVRRWERQESLPVHRHLHSKLGSIYAYTTELDAWFQGRLREDVVPVDPWRSDAAATPERLAPQPLIAAMLGHSAALSGRTDELLRLADAWAIASRGQQQVVLIAGDAGIGKTRVALEFARTIAKQATVLIGRCDRDVSLPFGPFATILQWVVRATPIQTLRSRIADIEGGRELAQIAPDLPRRIYMVDEPVLATPEGRRYRMFEACAELLRVTARCGPLLLIVEDIHCADRATLLLARHLIRSTCDAPLCFLLTCRDKDAEWTADSKDILDDIRREHDATRIVLGALSEDAVRQVIQSRIGRTSPPWLTSFVIGCTEGNPLFVTEMLERLEEVGVLARVDDTHAPPPLVAIGMPRSVRDVIERRLRRLSHATRQLLTLGAVIGREFSLSLVEALTDTAESAVLDALDEALASGMIVEEPGAPGRFAFAHAMIHEALYASITAARRVRMHHAIAEAIERRSAALAFPPLGELAHHFGEAALYKGVDKALYYAIRAGDRAAATLALEDAAFFYEKALRALDLLPPAQERSAERLELHLKQGRCSFGVGQWARARSAFESAISLLGPADDEVRCGVQVCLAETSFWLMDVPALRRHGAEAAALAARVGRDDLWADARAWMASALVADGDVLDGVRMDEEALARAGGARSFALARVPLTLYWVGRLRDAVAQATDAVGFARSSGNPAFLLYALQHLGLSLSGAGRYDEALQAFDEARTFGRTCGALPLLARATSMSVAPLLSLGHLDAAAGRAREARELGYRIGFEPSIVSAGIDLLLIFARSHDPGRAESLLGETTKAVRDASGWHAWKWNIRLSQVRAELALARGAWTEAIHAATQVVEQSQARHHLKYEVLGLATRARARLGVEARAAIVDARAAITLARNLGDPAVRLDCLGLLLDIDGSDAILDEAVQTVYGIVSAVTQPTMRSAFLASVCEKHPHVSRAHRQTNSEVPR